LWRAAARHKGPSEFSGLARFSQLRGCPCATVRVNPPGLPLAEFLTGSLSNTFKEKSEWELLRRNYIFVLASAILWQRRAPRGWPLSFILVGGSAKYSRSARQGTQLNR